MARRLLPLLCLSAACAPAPGADPVDTGGVDDTDRDDRPDRPHATARPDATRPDFFDAFAPSRDADDRPDLTVYGYWPTWGDPLDTVRWDQLTHLAVFDVGVTSTGELSRLSGWTDHVADALDLATPYDVHVHLAVTCFDDDVMASVLTSPVHRGVLVQALGDAVADAGAHGVNVDFEGLPVAQKAAFVTFVQELSAEVDEVFLAMPAVDWAGAYDYDELSAAADGLFVMGYDYSWRGDDPGPVAPLNGSTRWGTRALSWTVDDYRTWGATSDKLVLGLPLYGYDWPTAGDATVVPATRASNASAVLYADAVAAATTHGRRWDEDGDSPWYVPIADHQVWYDDADSLDAKLALAVDEGLQGFGFWALTYDNADEALWDVVDGRSHTP